MTPIYQPTEHLNAIVHDTDEGLFVEWVELRPSNDTFYGWVQCEPNYEISVFFYGDPARTEGREEAIVNAVISKAEKMGGEDA